MMGTTNTQAAMFHYTSVEMGLGFAMSSPEPPEGAG